MRRHLGGHWGCASRLYCIGQGGRWKWRTWKWRTIDMSRHEIDGHEIDGRENAGHVSGVWIGLHGIDFDWAVLPFNRLLLRCSRSKSKLKPIRLYSDDHCVFHTWICLSIILQLQEVYSLQLTSLLWLVFCRCFEKNCTLHCNVIYFQTIYLKPLLFHDCVMLCLSGLDSSQLIS